MRLGKVFHRARKSPLYPVIGLVVTQVLFAVMNSRRFKQLEKSVARRAKA